jgi:hypothetical protein
VRIYYYFVYFFRRLSRVKDSESGWRAQRADLLLLLVEIRVAFALVWLAFPAIMDHGSGLVWGLAIGAPVALATYLLNGNRKRYLACAHEFRRLPTKVAILADAAVIIVSIAGLISPMIVRTVLTGKDWWM